MQTDGLNATGKARSKRLPRQERARHIKSYTWDLLAILRTTTTGSSTLESSVLVW